RCPSLRHNRRPQIITLPHGTSALCGSRQIALQAPLSRLAVTIGGSHHRPLARALLIVAFMLKLMLAVAIAAGDAPRRAPIHVGKLEDDEQADLRREAPQAAIDLSLITLEKPQIDRRLECLASQ